MNPIAAVCFVLVFAFSTFLGFTLLVGREKRERGIERLRRAQRRAVERISQ